VKQDELSGHVEKSDSGAHMCVDSVTVAGNCHFSVVLGGDGGEFVIPWRKALSAN